MSIPTSLDFGEDRIEIPVTISGVPYVLCEATGDAVVKYRNKMAASASLTTDGKLAKVGNIADAEPAFVALCLFELKGGKKVPVTEAFVRGLPNRVMKPLYDTLRRISDMEEDTEESLLKQKKAIEDKLGTLKSQQDERKNDSSDTTDG